MSEYKHKIAVAGTHGKTTTTSMTGLVLLEGGLDPTILVGGDVEAINGNARLGDGDVFVTEACEAFSSFLELRPSVAVVTNIDADHLDHYEDLASIEGAFTRFLRQVDEGGCVIACVDDNGARGVLTSKDALTTRLVTYGSREDADLRAVDVDVDSPKASFSVMRDGKALGRIALNAPGMHNVLNALAAAAVGLEQGVSFDAIRNALMKYAGAGRRFEILGEAAGVMVVDDYAHHPAEIAATLQAAKRGWRRRVVAVFQPHLYSRTKFFLKDFAKSLSLADRVIVTDIYAAREKPIPGVSARQIIEAMDDAGRARAEYTPDKADVADRLLPDLKPDDMVIVMGAGDIRAVGEEIVSKLAGASSKGKVSEAGVK
jgi:UDP-N-acetylmuramate--alanine ligase